MAELYKSWLFKSILLMIVLWGCSSISPKNPVKYTSNELGMCIGGWNMESEKTDLIQESEAKWIRIDLKWSKVEPQVGKLDFLGLDEVLERAREEGFKVLGILDYDTPWIHQDGKEKKYIPEDKIDKFTHFVEIVAERYRDAGLINAYEIWNEPNWVFWNGPDDVFMELHKRTIHSLRTTDPEALIVSAGLWRYDKDFFEKLIEDGGLAEVDAVGFHPYDLGYEGVRTQLHDLQAVLNKHSISAPIWVTEIGYPLGGLYPSRKSEKELQGEYIKTYAECVLAGVPVIFWFQLQDSSLPKKPKGLDSERYFGLFYDDGTPKEGVLNFTEAINLMSSGAAVESWKGGDLPKGYAGLLWKKEEQVYLLVWKDNWWNKTKTLQTEKPVSQWKGYLKDWQETRAIKVTSDPVIIRFDEPVMNGIGWN